MPMYTFSVAFSPPKDMLFFDKIFAFGIFVYFALVRLFYGVTGANVPLIFPKKELKLTTSSL